MNVAIYIRKSREDEETKENTLERHERILKDYCNKNNLIYDESSIYREVVSGDSISGRPQMQKLLYDVSANKYNGVVVVEVERLSRGNQIDQAEILEIFKKSKTKIFTLNKIYDLSADDEFDEEFFEFGLFMSRREYKVIKRRLLRGKKQAQKEGYFVATKTPYGYSKERQGKGFVLIPNDQKDLVKFIFNKFAYENWNYNDIRNYLNDNGIKPKETDLWTTKMLKHILQNKTYIGYIQASLDNKRNPQELYKGKHVPIIDEVTFNIVQDKIKSKMNKIKQDTTLVNPMATLLKCSCCNKTMRGHKTRQYHYINCMTRNCNNGGIRLKFVEQKLIEELQNELKGFNHFLDNYNNELEIKKKSILNEMDLINKEIIKKENMINRCCEMLEEGIYTKEKYLSRVNILEQDLKALKSNLTSLKNINFDESDRIKSAIPILENVLKEYWNLTPANKNLLLKSIIEKIKYKKLTNKNVTTYDPNDFELKIYLKI